MIDFSEHREAVYYGMQATLQKAGLDLAAIFAPAFAVFDKSADDLIGLVADAGFAVFARR